MHILILMVILSSLSCDYITKPDDVSEVKNKHFEYKDVKYENLGTPRIAKRFDQNRYRITGKVKNESGLDIPLAYFDIEALEGDIIIARTYLLLGIDKDTTENFETYVNVHIARMVTDVRITFQSTEITFVY